MQITTRNLITGKLETRNIDTKKSAIDFLRKAQSIHRVQKQTELEMSAVRVIAKLESV